MYFCAFLTVHNSPMSATSDHFKVAYIQEHAGPRYDLTMLNSAVNFVQLQITCTSSAVSSVEHQITLRQPSSRICTTSV